MAPHSRSGPLARLTCARTGNRRMSRVFGAGHDRRVGFFVADVLGRLPRNPEWSVESWCLYLSYISSFIGSRCLFFGRRSRPVRVRSTMAGALRGVPAVMGDGTRRALSACGAGKKPLPTVSSRSAVLCGSSVRTSVLSNLCATTCNLTRKEYCNCDLVTATLRKR